MSGIYGLELPKNDARTPDDPIVAIWYPNPETDGFPLWGPSGGGWAMVRRIIPRQPNTASAGGRFNAKFWHSNMSGFVGSGDAFAWDNGSSNSYLGAHLYPTSSTDLPMREEVSVQGRDDILNRNSAEINPTYDVAIVQWIRVTRDGATHLKTITYCTDNSNIDSDHIIDSGVDSAGWGETTPPNPGLMIGDSPWGITGQGAYGHEAFAGVQGEFKIFAPVISEANLALEGADFTSIVTGEGATNLWYAKNGFSDLDDLAGDLGTSGRVWQWWDTGHKGTLTDIGAGGGATAALTGTATASITETDINTASRNRLILPRHVRQSGFILPPHNRDGSLIIPNRRPMRIVTTQMLRSRYKPEART